MPGTGPWCPSAEHVHRINNILKFINLRLHDGAQLEIQEMAKAMLEIIAKLYPVTVGAYREITNQ